MSENRDGRPAGKPFPIVQATGSRIKEGIMAEDGSIWADVLGTSPEM
jgi:hypothetical protein